MEIGSRSVVKPKQMRVVVSRVVLSAVPAAFAALLISQPAPAERVGPMTNGGFLLNSGWTLRPAGHQIPLDTLPMSQALSPDGKYLFVLNGGYQPPSISTIDLESGKDAGRTPVPDAWLGMTLTRKGDRLYAGGASAASIFEFEFSEGRLKPARTFEVVKPGERTHEDFIGDVQFDPEGRLLYAADVFRNQVLVINPQSGMVIERFPTGRRPYRIVFHPDGKSFFVSSWADGTVYHHETMHGAVLEKVRLGAHTTDMLWLAGRPGPDAARGEEAMGVPWWSARLVVTASNTNNVYVVGVSETKELRLVESINLAMTPYHPAGMTPSALGLSPDGKRLFVACSDANAVAVADVSGPRALPLGYIPAGWYPTAVRALADGRVVILNGKGTQSYANPRGPQPHMPHAEEYVARLQRGSAQIVPPFDEAQLAEYSRTVLANTPYRDKLLTDAGTPPGSVVPARPGDPTPIRHVIYIVKENRTYDQVFGDLKEGNGDPSLVMFGEASTPNHRKLAQEFVLLDNFYVNADVGAEGHNWSTAAIASDYVVKMWPNSYAQRRRHYDYEGGEPAAGPPSGYIWTQAAQAGVSMRNYGHQVVNGPRSAAPGAQQVEIVRDPLLAKVTNMRFRGFDLDYRDTDRAKVFIEDLREFEKTGNMPQLILMRLGNDHTSGTAAGKPTPLAAMADNDAALGMVVEAVSKSRFWRDTAIFVLEDDAQNGPDHVDSHRSPAFVISPYVRRGTVDSTMYNTTSMLRTMELILGLRPMTHFDAAARPMAAVFQNTPDLTPYTAEQPRINLDEKNPTSAPAAGLARLDLDGADRIDGLELNRALWLALRGPGSVAPAPSIGVFSR